MRKYLDGRVSAVYAPNSLAMSKYRVSVASFIADDALQNFLDAQSFEMFSLSSLLPRCAIMDNITDDKLSVPMLSTDHNDLP